MQDLKDRCRVDDVTGCWRLLTPAGNPVRSLWYPPVGEYLSLGQVIAHLVTSEVPEAGQVWHCTCKTPACANPAHRACGNRSSQMLSAGLVRSPVTRARIAKTKRKQSKLTQEGVRQVRAEEGTLAEITARHGIHQSHACNIRRGKWRNELAAPASSVFNWRPA